MIDGICLSSVLVGADPRAASSAQETALRRALCGRFPPEGRHLGGLRLPQVAIVDLSTRPLDGVGKCLAAAQDLHGACHHDLIGQMSSFTPLPLNP